MNTINERATGEGGAGKTEMTETETDTDSDSKGFLIAREDADSLLRALDVAQSTQPWEPQPGDSLVGVIVGIKPASGRYGAGHMLMVQTTDGLQRTLWLTRYLRDQIDGFNARPGDLLGIRFLGRSASKSGNPYNRYEVVSQKAGGLTHERG